MVGEATLGFPAPFQATNVLRTILALTSHISAGSEALNSFTSLLSITLYIMAYIASKDTSDRRTLRWIFTMGKRESKDAIIILKQHFQPHDRAARSTPH